MKALAIDLGGSHATCAVVDEQRVLGERSLRLDGGAPLASSLPLLQEALAEALEQARTSARECTGVVLGFPGIVDVRRGRVLTTHKKYADAPSLDLAAWARQALDLPFFLENDARLALLGERRAGAARGFDDVVMLTLGTGVGGVAMVQGTLLRGKHGQICLGGHLQPITSEGRPCSCGNVGCPESEASGWALPAIAREHPRFAESALASVERVDFRALFACAEAGDEVARDVVDRCLEVWSLAAAGMVHAYDPDVVIVGGGVMASAARILPELSRRVRRRAWTPWGELRVEAASLGNRAALLGAVPLLEEVLS